MSTLFIGDMHFNHANAIRWDNRPFASVDDMNSEMIRRWNNKASKRDTVYILGDVGMAGTAKKERELIPIVSQLNGDLVLIKGNHDLMLTSEYSALYTEIRDYLVMHLDGRKLVLFHYPIASFWHQAHGAYHMYAHVHNRVLEPPIRNALCVSACRDYMNYTPRTFEELLPHFSG